MKKFDKTLFYKSTFIFGLVLLPIIIATGANEEGWLSESSIFHFLLYLSFFGRFPLTSIAKAIFPNLGFIASLIIFVFNTMLYGFLIERLITLVIKKKSK